MSELIVLNNTGMIELERVVTNLYAKRLVTKDEIKHFINNLKLLVEHLPDVEDQYLH